MLTFWQEHQQTKLSKIDESLRKERDPKKIRYLMDKRLLFKNKRRGH